MGLAKMLVDMGQTHLFYHWADPGIDDEEKKAFFAQVPAVLNVIQLTWLLFLDLISEVN